MGLMHLAHKQLLRHFVLKLFLILLEYHEYPQDGV